MRYDALRHRLAALPARLPPMPRSLMPVLLPPPDGSAPPAPPFPSGPTREAAVLVLFYPDVDGIAHVLLTERAAGGHRHAGQISFPGGAIDDAEEIVSAALREAWEEVHLSASAAGLEVVRTLEPVDVRASAFRVHPVVATAAREPAVEPDGHEVVTVISAPVDAFLPGAPIEIVTVDRDGLRLRYGGFPIGSHIVWGATAGILARIGAYLGSAPETS